MESRQSDDNKNTDFEWENSKENVIPLQRGRNVSELNQELSKQQRHHISNRADLLKQSQEWELKIENYKGDDPLSLWMGYIRWIESKMPNDTRKKLTVLEQCTRSLKNDPQYHNSSKYLTIWIQYANLVTNPKDIFKYLYQNKIGQHVALFYIGWALVLERLGDHAQAHKIFLKAIQKAAKPSELLEQKFNEFQRRMSRHWLRMNETGHTQESETDLANERRVLENLHTFQSLDQIVSSSRLHSAQHVRNHTNTENPEFSVHEDSIELIPEITEESDAKWKELGTLEEQEKENVITPTVWNKSGLHSRTEAEYPELDTALVPPRGETLQVYIDENSGKDKPQVKRPSGRKRCLHQREDLNPTEEEMLLKKPLKNFYRASEPSKSIGKDKQYSVQDIKPARGIPSEHPAYDSESIKTTDGAVMCFEELRARNFRAKPRPTYDVPKSTKQIITTPTGTSEGRGGTGINAFLKPQPSGISDASDTKLEERKKYTAPEFKSRQLNPIVFDEVTEDVTINTRVAMADVNEMFCSPKESFDEVAPIKSQSKAWEVNRTEPVERKLQFSIYEDSLESNGPKAEDGNGLAMTQHPFRSELEKTAVNTRSTLKKARKPLASRDDIVKKSRLTNRDVMLKLQEKIVNADSSSTTRNDQ